MTRFLKIQGIVFAFLTLCVVLGWSQVQTVSDQTQIIVASILILFLGVPHGALDAVLAEKSFNIKGYLNWALFLVQYCLLAALIVVIAVYLPLVFLVGFLVISVFHFSTDLTPNVPFVSRLLYGGAIIFISAVYYSDEMVRLFGLLSGPDVAETIIYPIKSVAVPWLVLLVGAALYQFKSDVYVAVEMLAVAVLALLVPPLVSFTLYFCFMHSVRHIFRSVQITKQFSVAYHVKMVVLPMAGVFFAVLISWFLLKDQSIDQRIIQIVFLGLAALTVPHMVIIERMKWDSRVRGDMSNV